MKYIIIGSGIAGTTAARNIRKADPDSEVHLIGAEPYPYYQRPRLWEYIARRIDAEKTYFQPEEWYSTQHIELHLNSIVTRLDPAAHRIYLEGGNALSYDRLLLANGARPFMPPVDGSDQPGIFSLRTLDDAKRIAEFADTVKHSVVIGGGLLGLETANSLRLRGNQTTVVEFMPYLLSRQLDEQGASLLQSYFEENGIQVITGAAAETISRQHDDLIVKFKDGRSICGGLVLFSAGIRPRNELAQEADLEVNRAVVVNDYMETSAEDVYAAGDITEHVGINYGIIPAAMQQAQAAAKNMINPRSTPYQGTVRSNTLKIIGLDVTSLGDANTNVDDVMVLRRENSKEKTFRRLNIKNGHISGAILIGESAIVNPVKQLITNDTDISSFQGRLLEPDFDFKALALGKEPA
jgi:nitrite reductase (NADH) large subunit